MEKLDGKSLMVGDLLTFEECVHDETFPVLKVDGILQDTLLARIDNSVADDELDYDGLAPIELTPEMLEKNGFKQTNKGGNTYILGEWSWGEKGKRNFTVVTITLYKGLNSGVKYLTKIETDCSYESGINMIHSCDIESVHEFQHALKLCGIDKEIIL